MNKNPVNYFAEIEQVAFSPAHLVPGVEPSNDPVLQSRLYSYSDTHRHRLGPNYQQLPVNRPRTFEKNSGCPFRAGNLQRDGFAAFDNQESRQDYLSTQLPLNSVSSDVKSYVNGLPSVEDGKFVGVVSQEGLDKFTILQQERAKRAHEEAIWLNSYDYISGFGELDVEQPRALYQKIYTEEQKEEFVRSVVGHASTIALPSVKERVPHYFGLLDAGLGSKIAQGLGVKYEHWSLPEYIEKVGEAPAN